MVEFGHWGVNLSQSLPLFSMAKTEELKLLFQMVTCQNGAFFDDMSIFISCRREPYSASS